MATSDDATQGLVCAHIFIMYSYILYLFRSWYSFLAIDLQTWFSSFSRKVKLIFSTDPRESSAKLIDIDLAALQMDKDCSQVSSGSLESWISWQKSVPKSVCFIELTTMTSIKRLPRFPLNVGSLYCATIQHNRLSVICAISVMVLGILRCDKRLL